MMNPTSRHFCPEYASSCQSIAMRNMTMVCHFQYFHNSIPYCVELQGIMDVIENK